jgi:hypothetical protein
LKGERKIKWEWAVTMVVERQEALSDDIPPL